MFVIVDFSDERKRRFEKHRKHIIKTKRCDIFGGAPFFTASAHKIYFDRAELEGIIRQCGAAIFRDGAVPDGFEKYCFTPSVLPLRMLVKSAAEFFSGAPPAVKNKTVCVADRYAYAAKETAELSRHVRFVRVITGRADAYYAVQKEVYNSSGAVMSVGEDANLTYGSDCVIALSDGVFDPLSVPLSLVYQKNSHCDSVFAARASSFLPSGFEEATAEIDKLEFLCALFETCGYKIPEIPVFSDAKLTLFKTFT